MSEWTLNEKNVGVCTPGKILMPYEEHKIWYDAFREVPLFTKVVCLKSLSTFLPKSFLRTVKSTLKMLSKYGNLSKIKLPS